MQRLAEVLLEPRKQYTRLEKLVHPCIPYCSALHQYLTLLRHCCLITHHGIKPRNLHCLDCSSHVQTMQALALEKLLLVTSTVPQTSAPPPLPKLSSLPAVNENPLTPAVPAPTKGALASTASPHTNRATDRPQFPASGFGVAGAVLGTLTAGAASQFLPGTQVRTHEALVGTSKLRKQAVISEP